MTKVLQRYRHLGKLRDPEETAVRGHLRDLAEILAELRRQADRGLIDAPVRWSTSARTAPGSARMSRSISAGRYLLGRHVSADLWIFAIGWSGLRASAYVLKVAIGHHLYCFPYEVIGHRGLPTATCGQAQSATHPADSEPSPRPPGTHLARVCAYRPDAGPAPLLAGINSDR
jgi:hypothetical protein